MLRIVQPNEPAFTGFVFKIQANMDPNHRDRIAFLRVCSGRYTSGMKVKTSPYRQGDETRQRGDLHGERSAQGWMRPTRVTSSASTITASCRSAMCSPKAKRSLQRHPLLRSELFSRARLRDPMKAKQLQKGLRQLGEEGAVQVFEPLVDTNPLIGAVGQLQFEVVETSPEIRIRRGCGVRTRRHPHGTLGDFARTLRISMSL